MPDNREMRSVFYSTLTEMAKSDERIVLLEADMMVSSTSSVFGKAFPERLIDVGIAEANMIGVAAGLSLEGKIPYTHTFSCFATRRCLDQIFISLAYSRLNAKLVGTDPGVCAEFNGGTHMSFEDVGFMRSIPGMTIFEPVDNFQLTKAIPWIHEHYGPVYIRLFRKQPETVFGEEYDFRPGCVDTLRDGNDATIFAGGIMVKAALDASGILRRSGIEAGVVNVHTVKPIDCEGIVAAAQQTRAVVTAENHSITGGLGSAVAEVLAEHCPVPMCRIGVRDHFGEVGKKEQLMEKYGMTTRDIVQAVETVLKKKK